MIVLLCLSYQSFGQYEAGNLAKAAGMGFLAFLSLGWLIFLTICTLEKWDKLTPEDRFWCVIWLMVGVGA